MGTIYSCGTCGLVTTDKGHLCKPIPAKKVIACKFCGTLTDDPRHVCVPKLVNLKYTCDSCGRLAPKRELLCSPSPITKPKKAAKKPLVKATKKKKGTSKKPK
ncbi:MAG: hypothetical protein L3J17_04950 [Candidatus Jettenia sp.]|nr:MAG: hypothetical protein L3J17_04950 [Candidatus Jettenia sp.]